MLKRLFGWILALCMAFSLMVLPANAKDSNERKVYIFLCSELGCNTAQACGILANIAAESGFNPKAQGTKNYGICQWGDDRLAAMKEFAGDEYDTLEGQLRYMQYELKHNEAEAWKQMQGIKNTADGAYIAARRWAQYYERCWEGHYDERSTAAKKTYWPRYHGVVVTPSPATPTPKATATPKPTATPTATPAPTFKDVPSDAYYTKAVKWAVNKGVTKGTDSTHFSPAKACTRAEIVTFLWRAEGSPAPAGSNNPFHDVSPDAYYYKAVLWAVQHGITNGTSASSFSPNATVNRAQTVTFLYRAKGSPSVGADNPFLDIYAGEYYTKAVLWAVQNGVTNGTGANEFSPYGVCTRAQIVTFLYRAMT